MGVIRHADAGYKEAIDCAKANGIRVPHLAAKEVDQEDVPLQPRSTG
jgi:urocanate hydratase